MTESRNTSIVIRKTSAYPTYELIVDGVDMTNKVLIEGFAVDLQAGTVTLVVAADELEIDLPDVVVNALRHGEDDEATA